MATNWRLATFNLESLDEHARDADAFAARIGALRPILSGLDADVICLQEVNAQGHGGGSPRAFRALEHLLAGTQYAHYALAYSVNPRSGFPADVHNLVTLSRWPIRRQWQVFHDLVPVWWLRLAQGGAAANEIEIRFERPVLITEIAMPAASLHILNLHLRAPRAAPLPNAGQGGRWASNAAWAEGFHVAALKQQGQALEARLAVDQIFDADSAALIAVCGDLNADNFEAPLRILSGGPDEGASPALAARMLEALDMRINSGQHYSVIHDGRRVMLDHILASPALALGCASVEILNEGLADEAHVEGPVAGSLHAPLLVQFNSL